MKTRAPLLLLSVVMACVALGTDALGQAPGVDDSKGRILRLFAEYKCKCPKEDWTRTLAGCFEPCVDPQKALIRKLVAEGKTDEQIRAKMIEDAGTEKVLADAGALSALPSFMPVSLLVVVLFGVVLILINMRRQTKREATRSMENALGDEPPEGPGGLEDEIEKELKRLED